MNRIDASNKERLKKLSFESSDMGKEILFCPICEFQLKPGECAKPECPDCHHYLHIITVTWDLYLLRNHISC